MKFVRKNNLMKRAEKIIKTALSLALASAVAVPSNALASNSYSVEVSNATVGNTYAVYKVFDATYSTSSNSVAYTIEYGSDWWDDVYAKADTYVEDSLKNDVKNEVFELRKIGSTNNYVVTFNSEDEVSITEYFQTLNVSGKTAAGSVKASSSSAKISVDKPGYYFVSSTLGSVVSLTTAAPTATVIDKNTAAGGYMPSAEEKDTAPEGDPENESQQGFFVDSSNDTSDGSTYWKSVSTATIGDVLDFRVKMYTPYYSGQYSVDSYSVNIDIANGLTVCGKNDIAVTFVKADGTQIEGIDSELSISAAGDIALEWTPTEDADYLTSEEVYVCVKYSATLNTSTTYKEVSTMTLSTTTKSGTANTTDTATVYTGGFKLNVVDTDNTSNYLSYASFKLYTSEEGTSPIYFQKSGTTYTVVWDGVTGTFDTADYTAEIVSVNGDVTIFGLEEDTYYLEQNEATYGYNPITSRSAAEVSNIASTTDGIVSTYTVKNTAGTSLPSTGGLGATALYLAGFALVGIASGRTLLRKRNAQH